MYKHKAYKFRIHPSDEQKIFFAKSFGFPKFKSKKNSVQSYTTNNHRRLRFSQKIRKYKNFLDMEQNGCDFSRSLWTVFLAYTLS
ncbi:helix-turn-helix protein [Psychrobacillus insolitus]|uniref:Helix-turn-helix protein n=1 Tax=Psychrobacillus insolitus TaxID=1461 RepID=A0A2W7MH47_9BACI|nr:helix-turn-helix domain-containing protein [Psychrobacillus insolitus]PZX04923.1 helix-turn-helix protein [Psychrobacillus insolitus]